MSAKLSFVPSSQGDKMFLVLGDHTYYEFRKSVNFVTWRCTFRKCAATALVTADEPPKQRRVHCHQADPEKLERKKVNEACKRKAVDDLNDRPTNIMRTVSFQNIRNWLLIYFIACVNPFYSHY